MLFGLSDGCKNNTCDGLPKTEFNVSSAMFVKQSCSTQIKPDFLDLENSIKNLKRKQTRIKISPDSSIDTNDEKGS